VTEGGELAGVAEREPVPPNFGETIPNTWLLAAGLVVCCSVVSVDEAPGALIGAERGAVLSGDGGGAIGGFFTICAFASARRNASS
jgi:hypothetical protein